MQSALARVLATPMRPTNEMSCNYVITLSVGAKSSAGHKGDRDAKVPSFSFYPALFRPLTLVPIKRVLGVALANEIGELRAQPQRVSNSR
jgi:hypothetical protein